ncbi:MAG: type I restriction endonuclease subunit R, partial [Clostridia bacterium]|nr:type I restriction endonuclease subunit R [Clostridia bacterium]
LISCLITNVEARNKLLELKKGYLAFTTDNPDEVIFAGFSKETARTFIEDFEKCLNDHKDSIEALRIIYNSEEKEITHSMLVDLREKLYGFNRQYTPYYIWRNYKLLDDGNNVDELDVKHNVNALTNLIQLVRYAFGKSDRLSSLRGSFASRFNLYCGQTQRELTAEQQEIMRQIATYVVDEGSITLKELNETDTDLWRRGIIAFTAPVLALEMSKLSKMILKAA